MSTAAAGHVRTAVGLAIACGRALDLSACEYGPSIRGRFRAGPMGYYPFLAGLATVSRAGRVVEVGTHFGGSARAFAEGQRAAGLEPNVVTFDVEDRAGPPVVGQPGIERVLADLRRGEGASRLRAWAGSGRVDIAYVDALNEGPFVEETVRALVELDPGWLVVNDVFATPSIRGAWDRIRRRHGPRATSLDEVMLGVRTGGYGQGVVALRAEVLDGLPTEQLHDEARRRWKGIVPT